MTIEERVERTAGRLKSALRRCPGNRVTIPVEMVREMVTDLEVVAALLDEGNPARILQTIIGGSAVTEEFEAAARALGERVT